MNKRELKEKTILYVSQVVSLSIVLWFAFKIWGDASVQTPSFVGCLFTMFFYVIDGCVWFWVALRHKAYMASFFTGTSGARFLLALVVMAVYYLTAGGAPMTTFLLVFMVYYLLLLIHHSIFFSRVSKRV